MSVNTSQRAPKLPLRIACDPAPVNEMGVNSLRVASGMVFFRPEDSNAMCVHFCGAFCGRSGGFCVHDFELDLGEVLDLPTSVNTSRDIPRSNYFRCRTTFPKSPQLCPRPTAKASSDSVPSLHWVRGFFPEIRRLPPLLCLR